MNKINEKNEKLDKMIATMKASYPFYEYINALHPQNGKYRLGEDAYTIIVKGVTQPYLKAFLTFIKNEIIIPIIERDEELPIIITLESRDLPVKNKWRDNYVSFRAKSPELNTCPAVEDIPFQRAA